MNQNLMLFSLPGLVLVSALGYALSAASMKAMSVGAIPVGLVILLTGLAIAVWSEVHLLRQTSLSVVYIAIVVAETLLVLGYAASIGDAFTWRQGMGAGLVIAGLVTISI
jgi:small multidrug resistance pump